MQRWMLVVALLAAAAAGCNKDTKSSKDDRAPPAATGAATGAGSAATPPGAAAAGPGAPVDRSSSPVIGKPAPDFTLDAIDGSKVALSSLRGKIVVLEWFNPECPFVRRSHEQGSLVDAAKRTTGTGVVWLAVNSAAEGKQGYEPALNENAAARWSLTHPILRDISGQVGKAYGATNTPNLYVIDAAGTVVYAGAIDNSPDGEKQSPVGGTLVNYVDAALADLAAGRPVATPVTRPYGCAVKYSS
jgi:peroxiredoxin